jgi:hypothetical protein
MLDLELLDGGFKKDSTHKIFVDKVEDVIDFNPVDYFETDEKLLGNKTNRMKKSQLDKVKVNNYLSSSLQARNKSTNNHPPGSNNIKN